MKAVRDEGIKGVPQRIKTEKKLTDRSLPAAALHYPLPQQNQVTRPAHPLAASHGEAKPIKPQVHK